MPHALAPGSEVSGYRIESLLGEGATGAVYLARDVAGRAVALKVLDPAIAADARFRERFLRESRVAALLEHPNIVPVLDAGEDGGLLYIAMEWVDGVDLRTLLRRDGPLEPERAVALVADDATGPIDGTDDSGPTITLLALMALALGLAGVGFASWLAVSRKRGRATV